jgi:hypothetical protein
VAPPLASDFHSQRVWLLGFDARSPRQLSWLGSSDHCCRFSSVELTGGFSKIDFLCMI